MFSNRNVFITFQTQKLTFVTPLIASHFYSNKVAQSTNWNTVNIINVFIVILRIIICTGNYVQ